MDNGWTTDSRGNYYYMFPSFASSSSGAYNIGTMTATVSAGGGGAGSASYVYNRNAPAVPARPKTALEWLDDIIEATCARGRA